MYKKYVKDQNVNYFFTNLKAESVNDHLTQKCKRSSDTRHIATMLVYSLFLQKGNDLFASAFTYAIERNLNKALWEVQHLIDVDFQCGIIRTHPRLKLEDKTPGHRSWEAIAEGTADFPQRFIYRVSEHQLSMRIESCKPFFD